MDGRFLSPVTVRGLLDLDVWLPADADQHPIMVEQDIAPFAAFGLAFSAPEPAIAAGLGQEALLHTSLWSMLRATPRDVGVILNPGQEEDEVVFGAAEIDTVLGAPREVVSSLSRVERVRLAFGRVTQQDGFVKLASQDDADAPFLRPLLRPGLVVRGDEGERWTLDAAAVADIEALFAPVPQGIDLEFTLVDHDSAPDLIGVVEGVLGDSTRAIVGWQRLEGAAVRLLVAAEAPSAEQAVAICAALGLVEGITFVLVSLAELAPFLGVDGAGHDQATAST